MKVIEKFIKGKYDKEELCEDAIVVTEDFVVVIDGVTTQSDFLVDGKKGRKSY